MVRRDRNVLEKIKGKKVVLNKSLLDANDVKKFQNVSIAFEIPDKDDNISDIDRIERHVRNNLGYDEIDFTLELLKKVPQIIREKNFKVTITYIKDNKLDVWTHNKTIQKASESYRIDGDIKEYLRSMRINKKTK